jgi:syntaxin 7
MNHFYSTNLHEHVHRQSLTHSTQELIKQTTQDLKSLHDLPIGADMGGQQRMEQQKLSRDFQIVLNRFQQVQRQSAEKSREYVTRAKQESARLDDPNAGVDDDDGEHDAAPLMQRQQQQRQQTIRQLDKEIEYNEVVIADREQSIVEIEHAILEVNEIFRDLGTMVNDQQGMIDNIEANIESTAVRTGDAQLELQTAEKYQKKARNRMFCLLLVLAIITIILTIVLIK